ncbi:MAG: endonuclease MutS2 [Acidobacteria bacterium]|nr:endonuclease MutS2 [Acidobacteriota bacterium]
MSTSALEILEYHELLSLVAGYAGCPLGRKSILDLTPGGDANAVESRLKLAAEAMAYRRELSGPTQSARSQSGIRPAQSDSANLQSISFGGIDAPEEILQRIGVEGAALEIPQIISLLRLLEVAVAIRAALVQARRKFPLLASVGDRIGDFEPLVRQWSGKLLPSGDLDDRASAQLARIRQEIDKQRRLILSSLRNLLRQVSGEESAQDEIITVRGDRFVVPLRAQKKSQLRGVVHGSSSSGQTLYVEPLETIDANNDLVRLKEEEAREVHRILREITASFHARAAEITETSAILARLDHAFASARFAADYHCVIPQFCEKDAAPRLVLQAARHPLLESLLRGQGAEKQSSVIPLTLVLGENSRMLVISGPNTGGKTVAMKTAGLLALMALSGLPVPAERAELPFFDRVLADIGDAQSISENLSTFSSHLLNIKSMLESVTPASLILLDELGGATDPEEGGALAVAVMERFRALGVFAVTSTHHMALKAYAASSDGLQSGSMGFNEETLAPTYKLELGRPGSSSGLATAQRLGLPADVLARARQALTTAHHDVERFLARLQEDSEAATRLRADLEQRTSEQSERERIWAETQRQREAERAAAWEGQLETLTRELHERAEQKLKEIAALAGAGAPRSGKSADTAKKAAKVASQFKEQAQDDLRQSWVSHLSGTGTDAEASAPEQAVVGPAATALAALPLPALTPRQAGVGDRVHLKSFNKTGIVRAKSDNGLEVEIGSLRMKVSFDDVSEVIPAASVASSTSSSNSKPALSHAGSHTGGSGGAGIRVRMENAAQGSSAEINVIGETADDAVRRVDKFLDNALLAQLTRVRVVHGHGMGILKRALAEMFATHPQVEKFSPAPPNEGGTGATIVELKQ